MKKALHPYYLQQMGIESWLIRNPPVEPSMPWIIGESMETNPQAEKLLNNMLSSIGLNRDKFQLQTTLSDQLLQDINAHPPLFILAMGDAAVRFLFNQDASTNHLRGTSHAFHQIPLVVSYHPLDLLNNPANKKQAYQDLLRIQALCLSTRS